MVNGSILRYMQPRKPESQESTRDQHHCRRLDTLASAVHVLSQEVGFRAESRIIARRPRKG